MNEVVRQQNVIRKQLRGQARKEFKSDRIDRVEFVRRVKANLPLKQEEDERRSNGERNDG